MTEPTKEQIIIRTKTTYEQLPSINKDDLENAINACYEEGITSPELTKKTYRYLYPVKEPRLWDKE